MPPKSVFLAYGGPDIAQTNAVEGFGLGFECWNLRNFTLPRFVEAIQQRIPPINENCRRLHYEAVKGDPRDPWAIREDQYGEATWGLLLPDCEPPNVAGCSRHVFLLNLYSPRFLYPRFQVTDFGIARLDVRPLPNPATQSQSDLFRSGSFSRFFHMLIDQSVYAGATTLLFREWAKEDWRFFVACLLFDGLRSDDEKGKPIIGWQRETADIATLLETLLTAATGDNSEVGYKLRKRAAVLLGDLEIEKNVKQLYTQRSAFVHGSFFLDHAKNWSRSTGGADDLLVKMGLGPSPPFDDLYAWKECARKLLAVCLYLNKVRRADASLNHFASVGEIAEHGIIDLSVRRSVEGYARQILELMPGPDLIAR